MRIVMVDRKCPPRPPVSGKTLFYDRSVLMLLRWRVPPLPVLGMLSSLNPKPRYHSFFTCQSSVSSSGPVQLLPRSSNPDKFPPAIRSCCPSRMTISKCFSAAAADRVAVPSPPEQMVQPPEPDMQALVVVSFYKFADFPDHAELRAPLKDLCEELRVSGGIILSPEGINGSICGTRESVEKVLGFIQRDDRLNGLRQIESPVSPEEEALHHGHSSSSPLAAGEDAPFRWDHVRVKLKKEIVSLGMPTVSPIKRVGKYVSPRDWNALISDPDTVVIDVRNIYETRIGKFKGAVDPCTTAFREFPSWVENQFQLPEPNGEHLNEEENSSDAKNISGTELPKERMPQRVAMYCTGGIRCEKASSFLLSKGFKEVYHLKGGILKYLEEIPETESTWEGECFVFDKRVSVEHGLAPGTFKLCYGCKQPVSDEDMEAPEWEYGVSCPYCYSSKSEEEKERARARQRQFETWGIIGGPDKGRRPTVKVDDTMENNHSKITNAHQSSSV